jgi:hypothetical protein
MKVLTLIGLGMVPLASEAVITYVDAAPGNTTNLPPADGSTVGNWRGRGAGLNQGTANFGNNGGVYEGTAGQGETTVTNLVTTVSVPNGIYQVFAFFWSDRTGQADDWDITTGLAGSPAAQYTTTSTGVFAVSSSSQAAPETSVTGLNVLGQTGDANGYDDFIDGNRTLYVASIGTAVVDAGQFQVDVDGSSLTSGRTWYDGVGYRLVPEPSSALMAGLGLLGLLRRRR